VFFKFQCPQKLVSFDADFQLVRKASSGGIWDAPKHSGRFFEKQDSVDDFIDSYCDSSKKRDLVCKVLNFQLAQHVVVRYGFGIRQPHRFTFNSFPG
jgi:hypothetical protein